MPSGDAAALGAAGSSMQPAKIAAVDMATRKDPIDVFITTSMET
jgi:hypothetical protein